MKFTFALTTAAVALAWPTLAHACPTCQPGENSPTWMAVFVFFTIPPLIVGAVLLVMWRVRREERQARLSERAARPRSDPAGARLHSL